MRVLHTIRSLNPETGGPIEALRQIAAVNMRDGHHIEVASLDAPDAPWLKNFPLPCHALGPGRGSYGYTPRLVPWLRERADAGAYDAVIAHGLWQYNSFGVWRALARTGAGRRTIPYFAFPHGMLDPWFKRRYPLKHLKKWLYWPWGDYRVLRDARATLFTSEEERRLASQSFPLYHANERVVHYGTSAPPPTDASAFRKEFPETIGKRCVLFLGRVHEKKGVDLLLRAFAAELVEPWHLIIAGPHDNEYGQAMRALAQELGIGHRVTWTGMLSGEAKWGAFRSAEVFMLPSHQENFGIAVAEALGCGVPVLISDKVNIWREIVGDRAGFAEPDDLAGARRLLARWADTPADERAAMKKCASDCFAARFDVEQNARKFIEVLSE